MRCQCVFSAQLQPFLPPHRALPWQGKGKGRPLPAGVWWSRWPGLGQKGLGDVDVLMALESGPVQSKVALGVRTG